MKRLIKTRKLIAELIDEKTESKEGRPVPDIRLIEVSNELDYFEKGYYYYKSTTYFFFFLIVISLFIGLYSRI